MLVRHTFPNGVVGYLSPLLTEAHVPHLFSTRLGGVSAGQFASLNLGNPNGCQWQDLTQHIAQNYSLVHAAIDCSNRERAQVHQIHGCGVQHALPAAPFDIHAKADAIVSNDPMRLLSVRTADCVPVLLADRSGRRVAAVHAGWRGVIAGVITEALKNFDDPSQVIAAVGPCIGEPAFEVGIEVVEAFDASFGTDTPARRLADGKGRIDLKRAIVIQLNRAGVTSDRIDTNDSCTFRDCHEFFSHRRENGVTGRMAAVIGAVG